MGNLFDSTGFMPHGHCYLWRPSLVALHVTSDVLIAAAYFAIPALMVSFLRKRSDVPLRPVFGAFAAFIVSCGSTHVMEVVTLWTPHYWASGVVKALTALASIGTVVMLVPAVPKAVALPSPAQLEAANHQLASAVNDLQLHRLVLQQMQVGVLLVRLSDGRVVFANPRLEAMLGGGPGALHGTNARDLFLHARQVDLALGPASVPEATEDELDVELRGAAGSAVWTRATLSTVEHDVHGLVRVMRLRGRAEVERSLMADIVKSTSEAVVAVSVTGLVQTWNAGAERLYGYSEREAVGASFEGLTGSKAQYPSGDAALVHEARHQSRAGRPLDVVVTVTPIRSPNGALVAISKLIHDVTEQREARRALEASLKEKEVLLQEVHHRVKNNLQVVSSLIRLQADDLTGDESKGAFDDLQGRVRAIAALHEVLYQSNRLAAVPFEDYARRLLQMVARAHQRPASDIELVVEAGRLQLKMESGVPMALVLNELFVNALKHGLPGPDSGQGTIAVRAAVEEGTLQLRVENSGRALPEGFSLERNAGVGLRLVQSLLQPLKGRLSTAPTPRGAHWLIELPAEVLA
ncbi:MAG: histidine kinase dimerization/phosphoacceptor domain -containing protein [Myxococcaceae bacterium]|nr:histidine kinase dimerization/phosphoacceptor domain -containing protein [Myxococcaceae bacterium]